MTSASSATVQALVLLFCPPPLFSQDHRLPVDFHIARPDRFQLIAEPAEVTAKAGTPVIINVALRNSSERTLLIDDVEGEYAYEILLAHESGLEVVKTETGRHLTEDERGGSRKSREIQTGEVLKDSVSVTRMYVLDRPGRYFLRVARVVHPEDGHTAEKVLSNAVRVIIKTR